MRVLVLRGQGPRCRAAPRNPCPCEAPQTNTRSFFGGTWCRCAGVYALRPHYPWKRKRSDCMGSSSTMETRLPILALQVRLSLLRCHGCVPQIRGALLAWQLRKAVLLGNNSYCLLGVSCRNQHSGIDYIGDSSCLDKLIEVGFEVQQR